MITAIESIIKPKTPNNPGWLYLQPVDMLGYEGHVWHHPLARLNVISCVEVAKDEDGHSNGPEYHISISRYGPRRCTSAEGTMACTAFGMDGALEDNHVPGGKVRNFWLPVDESLIGRECECVATENAIVEDKGDFVWRT